MDQLRSFPLTKWAGKEENTYQNVTRVIPSRQLGEGRLPETSQKREVILRAVLMLLSLSLSASFVTMTIMYHQELRKKHQVAEAIQRIKDFLKLGNASYSPALEQNGPLLDTLQLLMGPLEEVGTSRATMRKQYSDVLTKLSSGWRFNGGNLYYFSRETKSWEEAEQFCVSQDSHLSSIVTEAEQKYLVNATWGTHRWIGLTDKGTEGNWRWLDGAKYTGGFWATGQPDNWNQSIDRTEDCVFLDSFQSGFWNNVSCTFLERWICKKVAAL
ncbi:unnamed protein product [Lepidochelys kempii]